MAAFSFEKISPPARPNPHPNPSATGDPSEKKQRGVITQMLDRLAEARGKRAVPKDGVYVRFPKPPGK
ncbi:hypothetical protein RPB_2011 [Rhodopseudomonas palustris HaA2]|uniref:Uncharacterized protein n=2 Tax=Rhodopseudomonas palustris TaxID=1076 RepID=Q2IYJ1_RHOP2|nr:hypothetical protein [Rhodopseudomonas palustris]ABD06719.1 hypothetical protein RPB_2011 [Rhodopseudomonas palustris HaA2]